MAKKLTSQQWHRHKRIRVFAILGIMALIGLIVLGVLLTIFGRMYGGSKNTILKELFPTKKVGKAEVVEMYLTPNPYSRPQDPLKKVKGIVIHYTANPGTEAEANRNYFESLKDSKSTSVSSHFVIGTDGLIIQCIPLDEIAYASNNRNEDTISIECCHNDETGEFTKETYDSLIQLTAWLCGEYNLKERDIIRHYDVTGKECPRYYVKNEDKWDHFKKDVFTYIDENME